MKDSIDAGLKFFESIEAQLIKENLDKFVVIKDNEIKGIYDTEEEAYTESLKKFQEGTFLIRQCLKDRPPQVFYSRAYL